jgi:hypothetical protein
MDPVDQIGIDLVGGEVTVRLALSEKGAGIKLVPTKAPPMRNPGPLWPYPPKAGPAAATESNGPEYFTFPAPRSPKMKPMNAEHSASTSSDSSSSLPPARRIGGPHPREGRIIWTGANPCRATHEQHRMGYPSSPRGHRGRRKFRDRLGYKRIDSIPAAGTGP